MDPKSIMKKTLMKNLIFNLKSLFIFFCILTHSCLGQNILIPMDEQSQTNHLKAYGIAYYCLGINQNVNWLLNYRGGSFLLDLNNNIKNICTLRGVTYTIVNHNKRS